MREKLKELISSYETGPNTDDSDMIGALINMLGDIISEYEQLAERVEEIEAQHEMEFNVELYTPKK
jgi:hypothetical protein